MRTRVLCSLQFLYIPPGIFFFALRLIICIKREPTEKYQSGGDTHGLDTQLIGPEEAVVLKAEDETKNHQVEFI